MLVGPNSIMIVHTLPLPLRESDTGCDSGHRRSIAFVQLWEVLKLKNPRNEKEAGVFSPSALFLFFHLFLVFLAAWRFASHFPHSPCCTCARK